MSLEKGCEVAVNTCMGVTEDDKVVIVSDEESKNIGLGLRKAALEITPQVRYFSLNLYGDRPLSTFPEAIKESARDATVTFWTAQSVKGELETVRRPFMKTALVNGRHAHMVDITEDIMETGMTADFNEVSRFTNHLHDRLQTVDEIRVKNPLGTDITVTFGNAKWVASTGINHEKGHWMNLPSGEIFTAPKEMDGKIVVDGVLGEYFGDEYPHSTLEETPLTVEIETRERAMAVGYECENEELLEEIKEYLSLHECSPYVGEFGLGTNIFLEELIDNMLQDEKFPGVHVAFGDPIAEETYASWSCPEHIDMVLTKCEVWFDDEKIMEEGEYIVEY